MSADVRYVDIAVTDLVVFKEPDGFREETGGDKVQEASRNDQENLDRSHVATSAFNQKITQ